MTRLKELGALTLPCALLLVIVAISGWGVWGLLRHWRFQVETQLRLDRCVASKTRELKSTLRLLENSNTRMRAERAAALAAAALGPTAETARQTLLKGEVIFQEGLRAKWEAERLIALAHGHCEGKSARTIEVSSMKWTRLPPDPLGPMPFEWKETRFRIELKAGHFLGGYRISAAEIEKGNVDGKSKSISNWSAKWTRPSGKGVRWASLR